MTRRLDPGAGWYGEFLRRDPEGMRACLDGAAVPPWDLLESLLLDLPGAPGAAAQEAAYASALRAAAVAAWDARPEGAQELRTLLSAATEQRAAVEEALRTLTARLNATADPAEAEVLSRELAWTHDDAVRATSRQTDLRTRLSSLPLPAVPRQRTPARPAPPPGDPAPPPTGTGSAAVPERPPVGRAEGRWLRGARRVGVPRHTGPAPVPVPPGADPAPLRVPRGARFGWTPEADPAAGAATSAAAPDGPDPSGAQPAAGPPARPGTSGVPRGEAGRTARHLADAPYDAAPARAVPRGAFVTELLTLRAEGRSGEAHALLCEAALWPAGELPGLAEELGHAGLAADWTTLLWEAASLPPDRLAAAAGALGEAGREEDADRLLRQGVARPAAEVAEAALALGAAGRDRETRALLEAFVRLRTADETAALARHDPHWFTPRLLRAARSLSATRHRDLAHALRVSGLPTS
ncbi:hypothetical protein [Streptomyces sp. NPDC029721]|uniref:hypothetical protein n=1 Tax=Streptomyces sp. NPDC029721 TaxID=3157090 RepID=UPI0034036570